MFNVCKIELFLQYYFYHLCLENDQIQKSNAKKLNICYDYDNKQRMKWRCSLWILNFKSGNKAYASRRYIPKIKEFLGI